MEIRILRAADAGVLATAAPDVFDDPLIPGASAGFLSDPRHHLVVAIDAGVVVGFVSAVHHVHPDKPAPELWINEVGVAPSHQRQGIARAMLHTMLEHARGLDCREAWVLTDADNAPARRLYASIDGARESEAHVMFTFPVSPRSPEQS
jgi:aminoglycoside 6'-N-acetyltransferase I